MQHTFEEIAHAASVLHAGKSGKPKSNKRGLTLIEAMLLVTVISIISVGAGIGLQSVVKVPAKTDDMMAANSVLVSSMEQAEASLNNSWPAATTFSPTIVIGASSFSPSITINNTAYNYGSPATYTSLTNSLSINNKTYQLSMAADQADPSGGSTYKSSFLQITVAVTPYVSGSLSTTGTQKMVAYVAQK